jgi:hypothetical protein
VTRHVNIHCHYLAAEQDIREYAADRGWMHSAAHTADLLKFLGRSRHLDVAGQARLLNAVAQKLASVSVAADRSRTYELRFINVDGTERVEVFSDEEALSNRERELEWSLIMEGWTGPHEWNL